MILLGVALVLLYAAVKDRNPVDVVKSALGGKGGIHKLSDKNAMAS